MRARADSGIALVLAIFLTSMLSAAGLGLLLVVFMNQLASRNHRGGVALLYAADAGIEIAARDMGLAADWGPALAGDGQSSFADGPPSGARPIPGGGAINLLAETNALNCGRVAACSAAQMNANTRERPWGANNPRWRLFAYGPIHRLPGLMRPPLGYLVVWVADDAREVDGDPAADAAGPGPGWRVVRVRSAVYGPLGARRAIEAELRQICATDQPVVECAPGVRVQSWQEVRQLVP